LANPKGAAVKLSSFGKKVSYALMAAVVAASGALAVAQPATAPKGPATTGPVALPTTNTAPDPIILSINGAGLKRDDMVNILLAVGGLRVMDEYWGWAVTMQAVSASGIEVKPEDIQKIKDDLVAKIAQGQTLSKEQKDKLIYDTLVSRGIATNPQLDWYFGTYAGLQILAERSAKEQITPTKEELAKAKAAAFGEKAIVFDFIVKDEAEGAAVIGDLNKGEKPEAVANKHRTQGLTVAKEDQGVPEIFRNEIWNDIKTAGKWSKLAKKDPRSGLFHVIYVQSFEAANASPKPEDVKKLEDAVAEQKAAQWRTQHLMKLKRQSLASNGVKINDPILLSQFNALLEQQQKAMEAQATQPGIAPATGPATAPK
jgi:hypothetical protein